MFSICCFSVFYFFLFNIIFFLVEFSSVLRFSSVCDWGFLVNWFSMFFLGISRWLLRRFAFIVKSLNHTLSLDMAFEYGYLLGMMMIPSLNTSFKES